MSLICKQTGRNILVRLSLALTFLGTILVGCSAGPTPDQGTPSATASATRLPTLTATVPTPSGYLTPRSQYPSPEYTPVTPIPPPVTTVQQPSDVKTIILLGTDSISPFTGRTDAIMLVFYSPRLGKASLLSIPPDLFVYLPGYTMQRLNSAYAIGGISLVSDALQYNLGVRPEDYVVVSLESFVYLIDDLGGIQVTVTEKVPPICSDVPVGSFLLDGDRVMCYLRYRNGADELNRSQREQEVFRLVMLRMLEGGNLVRLPELYKNYHSSVDSSFNLAQITGMIPFALRLGDANHLGEFQIRDTALQQWQIPDGIKPTVFLPVQNELVKQVQEAIDFVQEPKPNTDRLLTLEYELTISPTPTQTGTPTPTPTNTSTIPPTSTRVPSATYTRTPTRTITNTPNGSETATPTPNGSETATPTPTPSETSTETETP